MKPQNKKLGRPLKNNSARTEKLNIRLTQEEKNKIANVSNKIEKSKADTIMYAIDKLSESLKNE